MTTCKTFILELYHKNDYKMINDKYNFYEPTLHTFCLTISYHKKSWCQLIDKEYELPSITADWKNHMIKISIK